ncbi:MAG: VanZ family protein [Clostridia bacterium]|nr:VanZ family protein [Clostridia bacterium]
MNNIIFTLKGILYKITYYAGKMFYMYSWDYITLAIMIFVISLGFLLMKHYMKRKKKTFQIIAITAFFIYLAMVIYSAILNRDIDSTSFGVSLIPFHSYKMIAEGNRDKIREVIMNVAFFYPIGFLYCLIDTKKINQKKWPIIAMSAALSLLIELVQFIFKLGFVETDDIIHNTLGCIFGILGYILLDYMTFNERDF